MCFDVALDGADGLEVCGVHITVGNFDAAVLFKDGDEINQRKTIEHSFDEKIFVWSRRCDALLLRLLMKKIDQTLWQSHDLTNASLNKSIQRLAGCKRK